jgi:hypothetical protein
MASFTRTFKFYMGTVAFGSLLIAIMQVRETEGREGGRDAADTAVVVAVVAFVLL